jgi:competence protein ComEA
MSHPHTGKTPLFVQVLLLSLCMLAGHGSLAQAASTESPAFSGELQVNINEADAATIADILVGIGVSKAMAIVEYREEHGRFTSLDQLTEVSGIGEATVMNNRERIRLE